MNKDWNLSVRGRIMCICLVIDLSEVGFLVFQTDLSQLNIKTLLPRSNPGPMSKRADLVGDERNAAGHWFLDIWWEIIAVRLSKDITAGFPIGISKSYEANECSILGESAIFDGALSSIVEFSFLRTIDQ